MIRSVHRISAAKQGQMARRSYPSPPPASHVHWLRVPPTPIAPLSASERQSGWVLGVAQGEKLGASLTSLSQYSSGSRTVVTLRSASVMIQILVPLLRV